MGQQGVRTVFFGSPQWALPSLGVLAADKRVRLVGVVTQPPQAAGRGSRRAGGEGMSRQLRSCAVHQQAERWGLPWLGPASLKPASLKPASLKPASLKPEEIGQVLEAWGMELGVVCAYGRLLPPWMLQMAHLGMFNLHFSLLPRWRGASPVQAVLLAGDKQTGVTLQRMEEHLDAGCLVGRVVEAVCAEDDASSLAGRLAERSAELLRQCLGGMLEGRLEGVPQQEAEATWCKRVRKQDGGVDFFLEDAATVLRKYRAYKYWPGCSGLLEGRRVIFLSLEEAEAPSGEAGVLHADGRVRTRRGGVRLLRVQLEGGRPLDWADFARGRASWMGKRFAAPGQRTSPS